MVENSKNIFEKNNYYRIFSRGVIKCDQYNYFIISGNVKLHDQEDEVISFKSEREAYNFSRKVFESHIISMKDIEKYLEENKDLWDKHKKPSFLQTGFIKQAGLLKKFSKKIWNKLFVKVPSVHCPANFASKKVEEHRFDKQESISNNQQTYPCKWVKCEGKHSEKNINEILYPNRNKGKIDRGDYKGDWVIPTSGETPNRPITPTNYYEAGLNSKNKNIEKAKSFLKTTQGNQYVIQKHHIIPVGTMKKFKEKPLGKNAILVGWNINEDYNGVCLPYFVTDIFRHNLQVHRGNHINYNNTVEEDLNELNKECKFFCKKACTQQLFSELKEIAQDYKQDIEEWDILLRSNALSERKESYTNAGF